MNSISASGPSASVSGASNRRALLLARVLTLGSIAYALLATATLPHRLSWDDAADVFIAGAVPGLLVTVLLGMARPGLIDWRLRRALLGLSLTGAAAVAMLPFLVGG